MTSYNKVYTFLMLLNLTTAPLTAAWLPSWPPSWWTSSSTKEKNAGILGLEVGAIVGIIFATGLSCAFKQYRQRTLHHKKISTFPVVSVQTEADSDTEGDLKAFWDHEKKCLRQLQNTQLQSSDQQLLTENKRLRKQLDLTQQELELARIVIQDSANREQYFINRMTRHIGQQRTHIDAYHEMAQEIGAPHSRNHRLSRTRAPLI